ncbi:MAG: MlaD family protein [Gammaproteobacteria bacterium]
MSKQTNPTLIGAFVIGAVALIAAAVALFGGSELFKETTKYVTYFDRSVKGLRVGSNVLFKGVRVGYVTDIRVVGDIDTLDFGIPVTFEILPDAVSLIEGDDISPLSARPVIDLPRLVDAGLRAQLNSESLITGQLLIELDLVPASPAIFRGINPPYPEVPSIPSDIQQALEDARRFISEVQSSVDVREVLANLQNVIAGLDRIINSEEVENTVAGVERFVNSEDTQTLAASMHRTIRSLRVAAADVSAAANTTDTEIKNLAQTFEPTLRNLDAAVDEGARVLKKLGDQVGAESEIQYELVNTLTEIQRAARSLRNLLEYLERNPDALLKGKKE